MAIHFKREITLSVPQAEGVNVTESIKGGSTLPDSRYIGFGLGAESDFDTILIRVGDGTIVVPAGTVVPIVPFSGAPQLVLPYAMGIVGAFVHVVGYQCLEELAARPRRAPYRRRFSDKAAVGGGQSLQTHRIPFAGRRHLMIRFAASGTNFAWDMIGYIGSTDAVGYSLFAEGPLDASAGITRAKHFGGTNEEELFDVLEFSLSADTASTPAFDVQVIAVGEAGD
jgi:hypothetical protein